VAVELASKICTRRSAAAQLQSYATRKASNVVFPLESRVGTGSANYTLSSRIRPPARLPKLWQQHPELAPPRRVANAAFLRGNLLAGLFTRFPAHPTCGARTKRGPCKAPRVAGANRCRHHGGGKMLLRRARQTLATTRSRSIMAKCLWYLSKAHRNQTRRHLKAGERQLALREAEAQRAIAFVSQAVREGWATAELVGRLYRAGDKVRPYRPQDVACAVEAFLNSMSSGQPQPLRFEAFASELQLDEEERSVAAAIIGLRLPEERDLRNPNEQVEHALASRSLVRRAGKRQQI
jgi:hypothetical protein